MHEHGRRENLCLDWIPGPCVRAFLPYWSINQHICFWLGGSFSGGYINRRILWQSRVRVDGPIKHSDIVLFFWLPFTLRYSRLSLCLSVSPEEPLFSLFPTSSTPHRLELIRVLTRQCTHSLSSDPSGNKEAKGRSTYLVSSFLALSFPALPFSKAGGLEEVWRCMGTGGTKTDETILFGVITVGSY